MAKLTRLRDVRQRKAFTQQQLAAKAGVNRVTIARLEGGKDDPFPTTVRKVADALGVEPEDLLAPVTESLTSKPSDEHVDKYADEHGADIVLDGRITVLGAPDVYPLLRANPDLAAVIGEAADQLVRFIPDARLTLELLTDPEYGDEELLLGVETSLRGIESLDALERFDDAWWRHNIRRARGLFFVNLRDR